MKKSNNNQTLRAWIQKYPHLQRYLKAQLAIELGWSPEILTNKLSGRTAITLNEQRAINELTQERLFNVEPIRPIQIPTPATLN